MDIRFPTIKVVGSPPVQGPPPVAVAGLKAMGAGFPTSNPTVGCAPLGAQAVPAAPPMMATVGLGQASAPVPFGRAPTHGMPSPCNQEVGTIGPMQNVVFQQGHCSMPAIPFQNPDY